MMGGSRLVWGSTATLGCALRGERIQALTRLSLTRLLELFDFAAALNLAT